MSTTGSGPHPVDDLAAYAVGALDPDEHRVVDAHLASCPRCCAQLAGYLETLATFVPDEEPPSEIWTRIRATTATTAQEAPAAPIDPAAPGSPAPAGPVGAGSLAPARSRPAPPRRRRIPRPALIGMAAAVVAVALIAGVATFRTFRDDPSTAAERAQDALDDRDSTVVALDDPDTGTPVARVVVASSGAAYVLLDDLEPLPADQAYQLWRTEGTTPVSLGVLGPGTPEVVQVSVPAGSARLAISREPARGSSTPTGPLVAAGTLASGDRRIRG